MRRLVGALVFVAGAALVSGCLLNFDLPESDSDYVSTDPNKGCAAGGRCKFECGSDPCMSACASGSDCLVECGSGLCNAVCAAGADCTIACASGDCEITCSGKCVITKGSGHIQCSGPGCP